MKEIILKYGCNPNQVPARVFTDNGTLPFEVLNGKPGYINFLDAFNSWQLVKELSAALNKPAAASFKHVSPAGAAIGTPLSETLKKVYHVPGMELSEVASAYVRARGADRMSSFGDWAAVSSKVDKTLANVLLKEVSDGIIAPDYDADALEILKSKRKGAYTVIKMDKDYVPESPVERREVYGIGFEQRRNDITVTPDIFKNLISKNKDLPQNAIEDLIVAHISLKYTQSNSVCFTLDGQITGCGAGQQARILCTRLAAQKSDIWYLKQHPKVLELQFFDEIGKPERDTAIDQYLRDDITAPEKSGWDKIFKHIPSPLTPDEKQAWLAGLKGVSLGSDAFFPFSDNIDRAFASGVKYIGQPGGSVRDDAVIEACDRYNMVMAFTGIRLFHH